MVTSVSNNTVASGSSNSTLKSVGLTSAEAQQDRFLKLLVAQLNNQDPMNPMDNAQMTSQMAQINTVTGINQLNETIKSMTTQFTSMQMMQGAGVIGHRVLLESNTLSLDAGKARGAIDLQGSASSVSIQILSPGGNLLDTIQMGPKSAGQHTFEWDASAYKEKASPTFKVIATNGKKSVESTAFAQDTIASTGINGRTMTVQLKGRPPVAYDAIRTIF